MRRPPRSVPPRDCKYMALAFMNAGFSKDPDTRMGAIVVSSDNEPLGMGYNGPPKEMSDDDIDWTRPNKYKYIIHAEDNAIIHSDRKKVPYSTIYVTGRPCRACMLKIVKAKIKTVVFFPYKSLDPKSMLANKEDVEVVEDIARRGGVTLTQFNGNLNWMRDYMNDLWNLGIFSL